MSKLRRTLCKEWDEKEIKLLYFVEREEEDKESVKNEEQTMQKKIEMGESAVTNIEEEE